MNINRRMIIGVGTLLFLLAGLFPPWKYVYHANSRQVTRPAGIHFLFRPPSPSDRDVGELFNTPIVEEKSSESLLERFLREGATFDTPKRQDISRMVDVSINFTFLLVEWITILGVVSGLVVRFHGRVSSRLPSPSDRDVGESQKTRHSKGERGVSIQLPGSN